MTGCPATETNFNHHDPEIMQDPYSLYAKVRSGGCPLAHSPELGGFYFPTTYDGVKRVFSDFKTFSSAQGSGLPDQLVKLLPVDLDPPHHTRWRRVLNRFFTVEAAEADMPRLQGIADRLINEFSERGHADAVNELTRQFLAMTMLPVLGVPDEDRKMLGDKIMWMVFNRMTDHEGWVQRYGEVADYLTGLVAKRRTSEPVDDLTQCLIEEEFDGQMLTDVQGYQVLLLTLFGALDSTSSAMSGSLYHLARNPQDKERLMSGEVPWPVAIEEFLRFTTPIVALRRTVLQETELDGSTLEPGVFVLACNGAANRDPAKFADPDTLKIDREDAGDHMTFGAGGHICIGRHYARAMIKTCLSTMMRRLPDFAVAEGFEPEYTSSEARALKSLPLVFTPTPRVNA